MRLYLTPGFIEAKSAHQAAYAAYHAYLDENEVGLEEELHGPHAQAESEALYTVLGYPATTSAEVGAKLSFMREREVETWTGYAEWMAQIERELIELQRPYVSPEMAEAFNRWRDAYEAHQEDCEGADLFGRHSAAFVALMEQACFTPGDFIVKVYANQLGEHGSTYMGPGLNYNAPGAFMFELDDESVGNGNGTHDVAAAEAYARDIRECDLGRCLRALGRVDFEAEGWFAAVRRAGMVAHVVIQTDGTKVLWTGQPQGEVDERAAQRFEICQALLGAGMGIIGQERRAAVIEFIISTHPDLVMDCHEQREAAA